MKKSITRFLETLHASLQSLDEGAVADYIPELARTDPDQFGIALVTVDGHVHQVGDSLNQFTIQSISKAFTYGIALQDQGVDKVRQKINVEPSGEAFNSISLERDTGRPRNPMINAGAIVATSLVEGNNGDEIIQRILKTFSELAARRLDIDETVYLSEKNTGHRNRAIAHLLRNYEVLEENPEQALDAYIRQCSILVSAQDLAVMGATLANKGVNPITSVPVLDEHLVPSILAVMSSCGMYDYSGNWIRSVGMPAKSGVGGGIMAVLPGQFGLAIYSPRLDERGNSLRGIRVCEAISDNYNVHMFNSARHTTSNTLKALYSIGEVSSRFERESSEIEHLRNNGERVMVCELTGEQSFITTESLTSHLLLEMQPRDTLIMDFQHVTGSDHATATILAEMVLELLSMDKTIIFSGMSGQYDFHRKLAIAGLSWQDDAIKEFAELDLALQFCEEKLLAEEFDCFSANLRVPMAKQPLLQGLTNIELAWLRGKLETADFEDGEYLCRIGEPSDKIFMLERGKVEIILADESKNRFQQSNGQKLASFCGGAVVGEAAFFDHAPRTANVVAVGIVESFSLAPESIASDSDDDLAAHVRAKIFHNLARLGFERLQHINRMVRTLSN